MWHLPKMSNMSVVNSQNGISVRVGAENAKEWPLSLANRIVEGV